MPTLILAFPAGRFHATPWGHHVNEGLIEWPPSPWRLLRALLATGYTTLHWPSEAPPAVARSLIEKLASVLPVYQLPNVNGTHSRHYMPMARFKNEREETSLVFDTWARVPDNLAVTWNIEVTADEHALLGQLAQRMSYLGRSESWVNARLATAPIAHVQVHGGRCWPEGSEPAPSEPGWEQVPTIAPLSDSDYGQWRESSLAQATKGLAPTGKTKKAWEKAIAPYPADLLACLQMQTNELQAFGWNQPPGSRRVFYWRKVDAMETAAPKPRTRELSAPPVKVVLLSITTASGNDHALPHVSRTLSQGEILHRHLGGALRRLELGHSEVLSGCDEERTPLKGRHEHAHILPLDLDGDQHLDHVLIWAPIGLDASAQQAIRAVRNTFTKGGIGPLRLAIAATARETEELMGLSGAYGAGISRFIGISRIWVSARPFVPPRHIKKRGRNTLEGQVRAELGSRGIADAEQIELLDPHVSDLARQQRHGVRNRRFGPPPPVDCGFTLRLTFAKPVGGPVCLGYGSHYGLGIFAAT